tara:strand:+ start:148 stop:390 length:243 start_codon:yes stop_codon:yes gene_type:complete
MVRPDSGQQQPPVVLPDVGARSDFMSMVSDGSIPQQPASAEQLADPLMPPVPEPFMDILNRSRQGDQSAINELLNIATGD